MSCIKSIQRGTGNSSTTSFTINKVNPDKCIVIISALVGSTSILYKTADNSYAPGYYTDTYGGVLLSSISSTTLSFSGVRVGFSWQLMEFA